MPSIVRAPVSYAHYGDGANLMGWAETSGHGNQWHLAEGDGIFASLQGFSASATRSDVLRLRYDFSDLPLDAFLVGLRARIVYQMGNDGPAWQVRTCRLALNSTTFAAPVPPTNQRPPTAGMTTADQIGQDKAAGIALPASQSSSAISFGGGADAWGVTLDQIRAANFCLDVAFDQTPATSFHILSIDYVSLEVFTLPPPTETIMMREAGSTAAGLFASGSVATEV